MELFRELEALLREIKTEKLFDYVKRFSDYVAILTRIAFLSLITGFLIIKSKESSGLTYVLFLFGQVICIFLGLSLTVAFGFLSHKISYEAYKFLSFGLDKEIVKPMASVISVIAFLIMICAGLAVTITAVQFGAAQSIKLN